MRGLRRPPGLLTSLRLALADGGDLRSVKFRRDRPCIRAVTLFFLKRHADTPYHF